jgi:hypothetical protein
VSRKPSPVVIAKAQPEAIQELAAFSGLLHCGYNDESDLSSLPFTAINAKNNLKRKIWKVVI